MISSNLDVPRYCPVVLTRLYLRRLGSSYLTDRSESYLVPRTQRRPGGLLEADGTHSLSYTTAMEDFRSLLTKLGYCASRFTEHSGKRGGATTAAERGMSEADLQRFGGWRSRAMAVKYTDASIDRRLKLSDLLS